MKFQEKRDFSRFWLESKKKRKTAKIPPKTEKMKLWLPCVAFRAFPPKIWKNHVLPENSAIVSATLVDASRKFRLFSIFVSLFFQKSGEEKHIGILRSFQHVTRGTFFMPKAQKHCKCNYFQTAKKTAKIRQKVPKRSFYF